MIVTQYVYYPQLRRSHAITVEVLDGETVEQAIIERGDTISEWILDGTYASTHAKIVSAQEHGEHVIIDMDPGMFRMTLHEMERAIVLRAIKADRAQRPTPDTHCFREDSPTVRCSLCGWLAAAHTGCDCEEED